MYLYIYINHICIYRHIHINVCIYMTCQHTYPFYRLINKVKNWIYFHSINYIYVQIKQNWFINIYVYDLSTYISLVSLNKQGIKWDIFCRIIYRNIFAGRGRGVFSRKLTGITGQLLTIQYWRAITVIYVLFMCYLSCYLCVIYQVIYLVI